MRPLCLDCAGELSEPQRFDQAQFISPQDAGTASDLGTAPDLGPQPDAGMVATSTGCNVDVETEVLAVRCGTAGCHAAENPVSGLDLVTPGIAQRVVDVFETGGCGRPIVSSASPSESAIIDRLNPLPSCGLSMPIGQALTEDERRCLEQWVASFSEE